MAKLLTYEQKRYLDGPAVRCHKADLFSGMIHHKHAYL